MKCVAAGRRRSPGYANPLKSRQKVAPDFEAHPYDLSATKDRRSRDTAKTAFDAAEISVRPSHELPSAL